MHHCSRKRMKEKRSSKERIQGILSLVKGLYKCPKGKDSNSFTSCSLAMGRKPFFLDLHTNSYNLSAGGNVLLTIPGETPLFVALKSWNFVSACLRFSCSSSKAYKTGERWAKNRFFQAKTGELWKRKDAKPSHVASKGWNNFPLVQGLLTNGFPSFGLSKPFFPGCCHQ